MGPTSWFAPYRYMSERQFAGGENVVMADSVADITWAQREEHDKRTKLALEGSLRRQTSRRIPDYKPLKTQWLEEN